MRDVLRLGPGDRIAVFDGYGNEFSAEIGELGKRGAIVSLIGKIAPAAPESPLSLTLAAAVLKSDKFDLVVQKAVELGVERVVPLISKRSESRFRDSEKRVDRWRRIALEASKQCGRARLMGIDAPFEFKDFCQVAGDAPVFLFSERGGGELREPVTPTTPITAVTGPEGGWDDDELALAEGSGFQVVTLGGRILRAETAAVAVAAILQHRFGDLR